MSTRAVEAMALVEDTVLKLERYCENGDVGENGHYGAVMGCQCTACSLAFRLERALDAEWEARCGKGTGTTPQSVGDAVVGEHGE